MLVSTKLIDGRRIEVFKTDGYTKARPYTVKINGKELSSANRPRRFASAAAAEKTGSERWSGYV